MDELTERQKEILQFILRTSEERGYPPTIREIGEEMEIRSTNGVNDHLKALERKGFLTRGEQQSRSLVPTKRARLVLGLGARRTDPTMVDVPVLGSSGSRSADPRATAHRRHGPHRQLPLGEQWPRGLRSPRQGRFDDRRRHPRRRFHLRQEGALGATPGEIVVALIEDEATCKRFYPETERIRFQPANKSMQPIYVSKTDFKQTMILGKVVGVYRKVSS